MNFIFFRTLSYYIPIWQRKFKQTVVPFTEKVLKTSKEYGTLVWIKSEPYRDMIVVYSNQGIKYVIKMKLKNRFNFIYQLLFLG